MLPKDKFTFIKYILLIILLFLTKNIFCATIGSDSALSISPVSISGTTNTMKGFAWPKYGLKFADYTTTLTYQSVFPVGGPLNLNGGALYLDTDLILTNTASITNMGTIYGQQHMVEFSEKTQDLNLTPIVGAGGYVLSLVSRDSTPRTINCVDWAYPTSSPYYLAAAFQSGAGNSAEIYSFDGSNLTEINATTGYNGSLTDFNWHPWYQTSPATAYYYAAAILNALRARLFTPPSTVSSAIDQTVTGIQAVAWKPTNLSVGSGANTSYVAVGTASPNSLIIYPFTSSWGTPGTAVTIPQAISGKCISWASRGSHRFAAGLATTTISYPTAELRIYSSTGTSLSLTTSVHTGKTINCLDWSSTGTFIAVGMTGASNNIKVYKYDPTVTYSIRPVAVINESTTVNSVSWNNLDYHSTATMELCVGLNSNSGTEFRTYSFNGQTLSLNTGIEPTSNVNAVKYSRNGTYIARGGADLFTSVYKELAGSLTLDRVKLYLNADLNVKSPITFNGDCLVSGKRNRLVLTDNGAINVKPNSKVTLKNIGLNLQKSGVWAIESKDSVAKFDDSTLFLNTDSTIGGGALEFASDVVITGPYTLNLATNYTSTIDSFSTLLITDQANFTTGKNPYHTQQPIEFQDNTATMQIDNSTLTLTRSGLQVLKGNFICSGGNPKVSTTNTDVTGSLIFGDGTSANDPTAKIYSGTNLELTSGSVTFSTNSPDKLVFNNTAQISTDAYSALNLLRSLNFNNGTTNYNRLTTFNKKGYSIIKSNDTLIRIPRTTEEFYLTATIDRIGSYILDTNDNLKLANGTFSQSITVSRDNNTVSGVGNWNGRINFINQPLSSTTKSKLTWELASQFDNYNINLNNGGEIRFDAPAEFLHDHVFTGSGIVDLGGNAFSFGNLDTIHTSSIYWRGVDSTLKFQAKLELTSSWTFGGTTIIDGNSNILELSSLGNITIAPNSTLEFRNMTIENLRYKNITCLDNSSKIIFNNVQISQHKNFLFDKGQIEFENNVDLLTEYLDSLYTFSYESIMTSTIAEYSTFTIHDGTKYSMGKRNSNTIVQPLEFEESSSWLNLNGGTLHITSSGARLTKGRLISNRNSTLETENSALSNYLYMGDGTNSSNDFSLEISGDSTLLLRAGKLVYNNYNASNGIIYDNKGATLKINVIDGLYAYRPLSMNTGTIFSTANITPAQGMKSGVTIVHDNITRVHEYPFGSYREKATYIRNTTTNKNELYLYDGDYFYSEEGESTRVLHIVSGSSTLGGSGLQTGSISWDSSSATLNYGLVSDLNTDLTLNGGNLTLNSALKFSDTRKISGSGNINLNKHKITFGNARLSFTDPLYIYNPDSSSGIDFGADFELHNTWTFNGNIYLDAHGNILNFYNHGHFATRPNKTLFLTSLVVKNLGLYTDCGFLGFDNSSCFNTSDVYIELDNNYSTTMGNIYIEGPTTIYTKNYNWTFDNKGSLTVDGATLWLDSLNKINSNSTGKVRFGSTGTLSQYLELTNSGTIKTTTNLSLVQTSTDQLALQIKNNSNAIIKNTLDIRTTSNALIYYENNTDLSKIQADIRANSRNIVNNSNAIILNTLNIRTHSNALLYGIKNNSNAFNYAVKVYNTQYSASNGETIQNLAMFKAGISIPSSGTVTLQTGIPIAGALTFGSNSTLSLSQDLHLLSNVSLAIGSSEWNKAYISGNNKTIFIDSQLILPNSRFLEFSTNTTIDGLGGVLDFGSNARVNISANKILTFKDIILRNITDKSINLLATGSRLFLQNVIIELSGNYIFKDGYLDIWDLLSITGQDKSFTFSSDNNLTIHQNSTLYFDTGTSFTFDIPTHTPDNETNRTKLVFENYSKTSQLHFNGANFYVPVNTTPIYDGIRLLGGSLIIENNVLFNNFLDNNDNPNTILTRAISLGNGSSDGNNSKDVNVILNSGARLETIGYLDYNNYENS